MELNILNKTGQNLYRFCPVSILPDIYLCLQSLSLCLYFCMSHSCPSWFFRTNIQNKKSKVNSFYVFLYFFCFTNIIAGLSSSSTFIRHGWCVNRFKRNTNLPGNAFILFWYDITRVCVMDGQQEQADGRTLLSVSYLSSALHVLNGDSAGK